MPPASDSSSGSRRRTAMWGLCVWPWSGVGAVIGLGAAVSAAAAALVPLPVALGVGFGVAFSAYSVEWLFTWRDLQTTMGRVRRSAGGRSRRLRTTAARHQRARTARS